MGRGIAILAGVLGVSGLLGSGCGGAVAQPDQQGHALAGAAGNRSDAGGFGGEEGNSDTEDCCLLGDLDCFFAAGCTWDQLVDDDCHCQDGDFECYLAADCEIGQVGEGQCSFVRPCRGGETWAVGLAAEEDASSDQRCSARHQCGRDYFCCAPRCPTFQQTSPSPTFCSEDCRCGVGEGDCDSDADCDDGLICGPDNGPDYGLPEGYEACVPSTTDAGDGDSSAEGSNTEQGPCCLSDDYNCWIDAGCGSDLPEGVECRRVEPSCPEGETYVFVDEPCPEGTRCSAHEICHETYLCAPNCPAFDPGAPSTGFCSESCPCAAGEGDCDTDAECADGLACGLLNGADYGLPRGYDVCIPVGEG